MGLVIRDDVSTPEAKCIVCTVRTRSHVLEQAKYSEYLEEQIVARSDDYASKEWEEVGDEILKYRQSETAVVMCHKCWIKKQDEFCVLVEKNFTQWRGAPLTYAHAIEKCAATMHYYQFEDAKTKEALGILVMKIKETMKNDE